MTTEALAVLDRLADAAGITFRFGPGGDARLEAKARGVEGALGRILARVLEAVVEGSWPRLKTCPNCSWAFYDHSPNRSAKWCSMQLCGNRLKTKAYYRRRAVRSR